MKPKVLVINGPNLDLLGQREPDVYGSVTLDEINSMIQEEASAKECEVTFFQSNHEGEIVDFIGKSSEYDGILINPSAYTHTSIAIRDALQAVQQKVVEVHLSNIYKREKFREHSLTAPACIGQITGFGKDSYYLGFHALIRQIQSAEA